MRNAGKVLLWGGILLASFQGRQAVSQSTSSPPHIGITIMEAVQSTLLNHPQLREQEAQVEISRGLREQASSIFDSVTTGNLLQQRTNTPLTAEQEQANAASGLPGTSQVSYLTNYAVTVNRLFRSGISITPGFTLGRTTDNLFNADGINNSALSLLVNVPLLRGRGRRVVAAQEQAAYTEVDATQFDLNQLIAQLISNTATDYWNLVAARKNFTIAYDAETRGKAYVDNVQALVDADHAPRNDLNEATANYAQRTSTRLAAEQQVIAAQAQLALDMGRSPDRILSSTFELADDLPDGEDQTPLSDTAVALQYYLDEALERRSDYLAARRRVAEEGMLLTAARNQVLPQINLNFIGGYAGLDTGRQGSSFFNSVVNSIPGPNVGFGVTYSFPGANQAARGAVRQADATARQLDLKATDLARSISAQVITAVAAVRSAILQVKKARQAVESFQAALGGERAKYSGGFGSIVDVLTVEDKLNTALITQLQAQLNYALALTQFRFATGTLLSSPSGPVQNIPPDTFFRLPFTGAPQQRP